MKLKDFQKDALAALGRYLDETRLSGNPEAAFLKVTKAPDGRVPIYRRIEGLENTPYVCLRLPTGGGKTIVGAHAIRVAGTNYVDKDFPTVLWLVPSKTIRQQTADALKKPGHPYREALDDAFEGRVRVFDISEIENIRPQDVTEGVCVVVATIQSLRVENTEGRDVYAHKEAFEPHFSKVNPNTPGLDKIESGPNKGKIKYSFANLMALQRPVVIVDEAHSARTELSFETLRRVSPSCIIELTATPDRSAKTGSNVLYRVSASRLKSEEMIKLPVVLTVHPDGWEAAITDALGTRAKLAEFAKGEPDYVRPILLLQAESKDKPANLEAVKQYLIETEHVAQEKVAIATGDQRDLDAINLFDPKCPIEVVITIQALKEGWDCSFAYVFCSTANIRSSKDVEQLLGRVLRMPYVRRRKAPELNKAYAHVASQQFAEAAKTLEDSMVEMGFDQSEAGQFVESGQQESFPDLPLFLQQDPFKFTNNRAPDLTRLSEKERATVLVTEKEPGKFEVEVHGEITSTMREVVLAAIPPSERRTFEERLSKFVEERSGRLAPSQLGESLRVPRLCVSVQGELELVDEQVILDAAGWNLLMCKPDVSDFRFNDASKTFEFDVDGDRVTYEFKGEQELNLDVLSAPWSETDLVVWLDKQLRQPDVRQEQLIEWLRKAIAELQSQRMEMPLLIRAKFILARKLANTMKQCKLAALDRGYQELLFGPQAAPETSFDYAFTFNPDNYPANWYYSGRHKFTKHFYPVPGELKADGEEFECAFALDAQSSVRCWVRNIAGDAKASMWLQTSTDRFYPDFVAELLDGRLLIVEYKGEAYKTNDDSREKKQLGELWERSSGGKALFLLAEKQDSRGRGVHEQIRGKIEGW